MLLRARSTQGSIALGAGAEGAKFLAGPASAGAGRSPEVSSSKLALSVAPPYPFAALELPGIALLVRLLDTIHARPDILAAGLLEAFEHDPDHGALQKLAMADLPGDAEIWAREFEDAIGQLNRQARQQRLAELRQRMAQTGLSPQETDELRELLKPA